MIKRQVVNFLISDEQVLNGLVNPYKQNHELSALIVKLLTVYYYSEEMRNIVDSYGNDGEDVFFGDSKQWDDSIKQVNDILAFMSATTQSIKSTAEGGIDAINDIVSATGGMQTEETDLGISLPSFGTKREVTSLAEEFNSTQGTKVEVPVQSQSVLQIESNERITKLESEMSNMRSAMEQNMEDMRSMMADFFTQFKNQSQATQISVEEPAPAVKVDEKQVKESALVSTQQMEVKEENTIPDEDIKVVNEEPVDTKNIEPIATDNTSSDDLLNLDDLDLDDLITEEAASDGEQMNEDDVLALMLQSVGL